MIRDLRFANESPVQHMWRVLEPRVESVRRDLAREFGCDAEEIAITRNASEAMETLIFGIDLQPRRRGHHHRPELPADDHELGAARSPRGDRRQEDLVPDPARASPRDFVDRIREAITPRTRVIEFPHITNLSGQILPVRDVVRLGKEKGIEVFIDGAHAFAHFPFKRDDLECDYYGCSLHKWLLAPIGTGFLYVRKPKQKRIWPMMGADAPLDEDIRKYEQIGTHPAANHNAISAAVAFHRSIGADRKIARLRYLRDRWARPLLAADKRVKLWTPLGDDAPPAAIGLVQIEGIDTGKLYGHLWEKHRIVTSPIQNPGSSSGVRVTPNVYTTLDEIDVFVDAMMKVLAKGV